MTCLQFLVRLDAGDPDQLDAASLAHARACADCGRALAQAIALEAELRAFLSAPVPAPVSPAFVDRLMARVELAPQPRLSPADVARATVAAFASPPIGIPALAGAVLIAVAAAFGFDPRRVAAAAAPAAVPLTNLLETLARPLPAAGLERDVAVGAVMCAALPLLVLLVGAAWQLGNVIGGRSPRTL